jgi:WD repeat-containing protein 19
MVLRKLFTIDARTNGQGPAMFAWNPQGVFMAVVGANKRLLIVNRQGEVQQSVNLPAPTPVIDLHWSHDGSTIAVVQAQQQNVTLYSFDTKKMDSLATGMKADVCIARWAQTAAVLCVGNVKGGVLIYNADTTKKIPIVGKHSKKIISMAWNRRGQVAMASEDKMLTVSDIEGQSIDTVNIKGDATEIKWADRKADDRKQGAVDGTVSMTNSNKTLVLFAPETRDSLVELAFNKKYGNLINFEWFGDGYLICGFAAGNVTVVSTHLKEIGNEVSMLKSHRDQLNALCVNKAISKGCAIGDNMVRVFDLDDRLELKEDKSEKYEFDSEFGALSQCAWTEDGQILTIASRNGAVYGFVTRIPVLSASYGHHLAYFSSLREICVRDIVAATDIAKIEVQVEPTFASLSSGVVAVGSVNQSWFYKFDPQGVNQTKCQQIGFHEARNVVKDVCCSAQHGAVLMEELGKSELFVLANETDATKGNNSTQHQFPDKKDHGKVTCQAMTDHFYIFGTSSGLVCIFSLADQQIVTEYRHISAIRYLRPNIQGTRIAWIDASNNGAVFNPASETATGIDGLSSATDRILWDPMDYSCFISADSKSFTSFSYSPNTRYGATARAIQKRDSTELCLTSRPYGFTPVLLYRGVIMCQLPTGALAPIPLESHKMSHYPAAGDADAFHLFLEMNRVHEALAIAQTPEQLGRVATQALHVLDVELAIRIYRQLGKPTMVMSLERIRHIHEKNILLGHMSMMFHDFDDAQNFFLRSSNPMLALEMRRDLMHWDPALRLAEKLAPDQVPVLSKECAQQLEFRGEYTAALEAYRQGHMAIPPVGPKASPSALAARTAAELHNDACVGGEARCTFRMGDVRGGMRSLEGHQNRTLLTECANILEGMKQFDEAAALFERAELYERAASIYIKETKQLKAAARVLQFITSRNILAMYAKAKEVGEHAYLEAAQAYEKAEDWDNVVRIRVEFLNDLHGAYTIVRRTRSTEAAQMVAAVCRKRGEIGIAVEFLLLAKKYTEAFELAKQADAISAFEQALVEQVPIKDGVAAPEHREHFQLVADYHAGKKSNEIAGDYYQLASQFPKALDKYLLVGTTEALDKAIAVVGKARSDQLAHRLLDYLMGEVDGEPKDPKNIFKLYMALGSFEKAAKTAVLIANKEQELGNYRPAHKILVDTCLILHQKSIRVPTDLRRSLLLLHSYIIVKHLMKPMDDTNQATRMLLRVARNIQKFPQHVGTILSSAVVQCIKAEFRASAYKYACVLVQSPELKEQIPEKHKKKIEQVVRKKGKEELLDPPEPTSQCPFCHAPVDDTALECATCKNTIPFCVVSGKHMTSDDWSVCPSCDFPALHSQFIKLLRDDPRCPLCEAPVNPMTLDKIPNPDVKAYV